MVFASYFYPIFTKGGIPASGRQGLTLLLIVQFFVFTSTFAHMLIAALPDSETAGNIATLMFSLMLTFNGVFQPPQALPGFWIFMYRVSPLTCKLPSPYFSTPFINNIYIRSRLGNCINRPVRPTNRLLIKRARRHATTTRPNLRPIPPSLRHSRRRKNLQPNSNSRLPILRSLQHRRISPGRCNQLLHSLERLRHRVRVHRVQYSRRCPPVLSDQG